MAYIFYNNTLLGGFTLFIFYLFIIFIYLFIYILQPALTAYQKTLHHTIHGPNEPLPTNLAAKHKVSPLATLKTEPTTVLPSLPSALLEEQKSLAELHVVMQSAVSPPHQPRSPAGGSLCQTARIKSKSQSMGAIRKRSSELLLNSDPEAVMTRYFPPLESLTDPLSIVDRLKKEPELGFLYLTPVEERQSVKYNPYNLR